MTVAVTTHLSHLDSGERLFSGHSIKKVQLHIKKKKLKALLFFNGGTLKHPVYLKVCVLVKYIDARSPRSAFNEFSTSFKGDNLCISVCGEN